MREGKTKSVRKGEKGATRQPGQLDSVCDAAGSTLLEPGPRTSMTYMVYHTAGEVVQVPQVQVQEKIVQRAVEQVVQVPRPQVVEKVIEVPKIQVQERIVKVPKVQQIITDTVVQNQVQTIEMEKPKIIQKTVQRKKPIIQEHITQVTKVVEEVVPVQKVVQVPVEVP